MLLSKIAPVDWLGVSSTLSSLPPLPQAVRKAQIMLSDESLSSEFLFVFESILCLCSLRKVNK